MSNNNNSTKINATSLSNKSDDCIVSVICSHESRIKCFLKQYNIENYSKHKVVRIELKNGNFKIFIDKIVEIDLATKNSKVFKDKVEKYEINTINANTKNKYNYIFYIFSCQGDESVRYKNGIPEYSSRNNLFLKIIKNKLLPNEPDYLFSSDLIRSTRDICYMYKDYIYANDIVIKILPCCHPTNPESDKCNGEISQFQNQVKSMSEKKGIVLYFDDIQFSYVDITDWSYYSNFYGKQMRGAFSILSGKKHCRYTTFILEAIKLINNRLF